MPVPISPAPQKQWTTALFEDAGAGLRHSIVMPAPDNGGANTSYLPIIVPEDGYVHSVEFVTSSSVAVNDTTFNEFELKNLGQNGLGNVSIVANTDPANTTKLTGGSPLVSHTRRILKLNTNPQALKVLAGDVLRLRMAAGTGLAMIQNSVIVRFNP